MDPGDRTRRTVAWSVSILLNALLLFMLSRNPDVLRQIQIIERETSEQNLAEKEAAKERIETARRERREAATMNEQTREKILDRLDQEKTHRAMTRVRELKTVYDSLRERRDEQLEALKKAAEERPIAEAAEELRVATADLAKKQAELAQRVDAISDRPETTEELKALANQSAESSQAAGEQADNIGNPPTEAQLDAVAALAEGASQLAEAVASEATDNITKARSEAVAAAAKTVEKAAEKAAAAEKAVVEIEAPEAPKLSDSTQAIAESGQAGNMEEAHAAAMELENAVVDLYDQTRAAELATKSGTTLETAQDRIVPTAKVERPNPFADANGEASLAERTAAMTTAERQVAEAAQTAAQRLALVEGRAAESEAGTRELDARTLLANRQLEQTAFNGRRFSDVAGLMQDVEGAQEGVRIDKAYDAEAVPRADAAPVRRNERLPSLAAAEALPGRRFSASSSRKGWLYLDTWYVIGPWSNTDITSFEPRHPPEERIDLDAVYPGAVYNEAQAAGDRRRGVDFGHAVGAPRSLRWRFTQSDGARVVVPDERMNATYYAYTDVYFEEPQEMLVAVGTDDSGRVWINGLPVGEDTGLTPWAIDETLRKVWFKKGFNEILVRLENGPKDAELSFLICPPEALSKPQ